MNQFDLNNVALGFAAGFIGSGLVELLPLIKPRLVKTWNAMLHALTIEEK